MIAKEREKNAKVLQYMNAGLINKDKLITEIEKSINDLIEMFGRLSLQLTEAKLIVLDAFRSSFRVAIRQFKHFFANKELDFNLLDST